MRIWHIPYQYLDRQRLQSQHYESHGLLTVILKGQRWGSISDEFKNSTQAIVESHDKAATEMVLRQKLKGVETIHGTPMEMPTGEFVSVPYKATDEQLILDTLQLRNKWEREGYFFGTGRVPLAEYEEQFQMHDRRPEAEAAEMHRITRQLVKDHKEFLKNLKGDLRLGDKLDKLFEHLGPKNVPYERRIHAPPGELPKT